MGQLLKYLLKRQCHKVLQRKCQKFSQFIFHLISYCLTVYCTLELFIIRFLSLCTVPYYLLQNTGNLPVSRNVQYLVYRYGIQYTVPSTHPADKPANYRVSPSAQWNHLFGPAGAGGKGKNYLCSISSTPEAEFMNVKFH